MTSCHCDNSSCPMTLSLSLKQTYNKRNDKPFDVILIIGLNVTDLMSIMNDSDLAEYIFTLLIAKLVQSKLYNEVCKSVAGFGSEVW